MTERGKPRPTPEEREAADWKRAREWAESTPDWSDGLWRRINAQLRYEVIEGKRAEPRESS